MKGFIQTIILTFLALASFRCAFSQSVDTISIKKNTLSEVSWGYFSSPVFKIYNSALKLNKNWTVGTNDPNNSITQMGAWISPKATGAIFLVSIIFGQFNINALQKNYETNLRTLILTTHNKLPTEAGLLVRCEYYYNDQNIADVNSIRFQLKGVGLTPESAYADIPIDQIDSWYMPSSAFPKKNEHFIWIFKNQKSDIEIETIKDPFITSFKERANKLRVENLKAEGYFPMYNDATLKKFSIAEKSILIAKKYETQLRQNSFLTDVAKLNSKLKEKQDEMNILINSYNQVANQQHKSSSLLILIDVLSNLNSSFNPNSSSKVEQNSSVFKKEMEYQKLIINEISKNIKLTNEEIKKIKADIEKFFNRAYIPDRLPLQ